MLIVSPSYKRAGNVRLRQWWPDVTLAVVESQADEYQDKEGGDLLVLPDSVAGNIAKTRNAILDAAAPGEWVVQMDDDVSAFGWFGKPEGGEANPTYTADEWLHRIHTGCQMADDLGTGLWGVNVQADPKFYREYTPIAFTSPVLGPFSVQRAGELRYDERLWLKEDYDLFLQALRKWHRVLRFNKYYYRCDHLALAGGVVSSRTMPEERHQADLLTRKWGTKVLTWRFEKGDTNPIIHSPIPGV